jgi:HAD superfamily hydrolase (TIGR01509 family)
MAYSWIEKYKLFLFDFDGLLVNTEELHFAAYAEMCRRRGFELNWTLNQFFLAAHMGEMSLQKALYEKFPELKIQEPKWEVLYAEKKRAYMDLLNAGKLTLMPGVASLLKELERKKIARCVVTNSTKEQVESIQKQLPELRSIPRWITREYYKNPKPDPECYKTALVEHGTKPEEAVGFEDSLRGFQALACSGAKSILIAPPSHPQMKTLPKHVIHFSSFEEIPDRGF